MSEEAEMELKESCKLVRELYTKYPMESSLREVLESIKDLLLFCESALKLQGEMNPKINPELCNLDKGYNDRADEDSMWLIVKLEGVEKIIIPFIYERDKLVHEKGLEDIPFPEDVVKTITESIRQHFGGKWGQSHDQDQRGL